MSGKTSRLKLVELALLVAGLGLVGFAVFKYVSGKSDSQAAVERFHANVPSQPAAEHTRLRSVTQIDYSLWDSKRIREYKDSLAAASDEPLALLMVDKIHLEVPVFEGTSDFVLNRGVGRVEGTARIGESGNVAIAGHRDGFFRGLKDVKVGDSMELETTTGTQNYVIDSITLVDKKDVSVLRSEPSAALTLVTCYPFYFVGSAPQRYIVHASLKGEIKKTNEPAKVSLQATASSK